MAKLKIGDLVVVNEKRMQRLHGKVFRVIKVDRFSVVVDDGTPNGFLLFKTEVEKVKDGN